MKKLPANEHPHPGRDYVLAGTTPPNLDKVDWEKAPRNFKLYRGCEQRTLGYERATSPSEILHTPITWQRLGQMLSDIYGFTRQRRTSRDVTTASITPVLSPALTQPTKWQFQLRRPVPSGGALFPCELYLLIGQEQCIPPGIYHYDAIHHALDVLRTGDYSPHLSTYLSQQTGTPAFTLLLSCLFWKNGYKYGEFSYRLSSLDIGVTIAQHLAIFSRYALPTMVHYQFLDQAVNQLPGLADFHESVYAAITVDMKEEKTQVPTEQAFSLPLEPLSLLAEPRAEPATSISQWPLLDALHRMSFFQSTDAFQSPGNVRPITAPEALDNTFIPLSSGDLDLLAGLHRRRSASGYFKPEALRQRQLADLLVASAQGYSNDIDVQPCALQHVLFYCVINAVEGISPGVYYYHPGRQALVLIRSGDMRAELQRAQRSFTSFNMFHVSVCLFPVADYDQGFQAYGDRWYRMQNMEAGIGIQRLSLAASALQLACRVNLAYHMPLVNSLLQLPAGFTCLAEVLIATEHLVGQSYEQPLSLSPYIAAVGATLLEA